MSRSRAELLQVEIEPGWWISSGRALYLAEDQTLIVADIHWGYADSHLRAGNLLPQWGDAETTQRLGALIDFYQPRRMIWLGDTLHTRSAARFAEEFLESCGPCETIVLRGNHDRGWARIDAETYRLGRCFFHHGDRRVEVKPGLIEVTGHVHPAVVLGDGAGLRLKVPALVQGPRRLILPSFSDWSSGATWNGALGPEEKLWVVSPRRIWAMNGADLTGRA